MSKHTNQRLLVKGLKYMAISVPLLVLSPYLITLSALNKHNFTFYLFLVIGVIVGIAAVFLVFKGLNTIMKSIF